MKKLLLISILFVPHLIFSQTVVLRVNEIPQQASQLCWAASMEMIIKFHGVSTINQCKLSDFLRGTTGTTCPGCSGTDFYSTGDWNLTINNGARGQFLPVLSKAGFYAIEDTTRLTWTIVNRQINNCRPFILAYNETIRNQNGTMRTINHAVVVKGKFKLGTTPYVSINDPLWEVCRSKVYALNLNEIYDPRNFIHVTYSVHNIFKKSLSECCTPCSESKVYKEDIPSDALVPLLMSNRRFMVAAMNSGLTESELNNQLKKLKNNYVIPVHIISTQKMIDVKKISTLKDVIIDKPLTDIIYTGTFPNIVTTFQRKGKVWKDVMIANSIYPKSIYCRIKNIKQNITLSFRNDIPNTIKFEYVKFINLFRDFYRFQYNGNYYLLPRKTYTDRGSDNIFQDGIAIPESEALAVLKHLTNKYY
jgi:hypothetical protein